MQKVPILPTTPWQGGDPKFSTPTVAVVTATFVPHVLVHSQAERLSRQAARVHRPQIIRAAAVPRPSSKSLVRSQARSQLRRLGHQIAIVTRPAAVLGVRREKTVKAVLTHRASTVALRTRLKRHNARILRAPLISRAPQALTRSITKRAVFKTKRKRHEPLILRAILRARERAAVTTHSQRDRRRALERNRAFIFKAPFVVTVVASAETIKHVYVRSVARLTRQRREVTRNPAIILRPPWTGVRREKTVKSIFVHGVGRAEQVAERRRHKAVIAKSAQRISQPLGRVIVHSVLRRKSADLRRHKALLLHGQLTVRTNGGRSVLLHFSTKRAKAARLRRHKALLLHGPITVQTNGGRRVLVPITTKRGKRTLAWHRRHFARILRSLNGQASTQVVFIEPFDQPTPTGRTSSLPSAGDYDYPTPLGRATSSPTEGAFDIPVPIGVTDIPDPEV